MLLNTSKQFGEKDIDLNKRTMNKRSFLLRLYITIIIMIVSFFTIYAYRNQLLTYLIRHDFYSVELTDQEKKEITDLASKLDFNIKSLVQFEQSIQTLTHKEYSLMYGNYSIQNHDIGTDHFLGIEDIQLNQAHSINSGAYELFIRHKHPLKKINIKYAETVKVKLQQGGTLELFFFPLFTNYYKWIRISCFIITCMIGIFVLLFLWKEYKNAWGRRFLNRFISLSIFKWCHHLSIKLLMINIFAFLLCIVLFLYLFLNRYSFFEFMNELQYNKGNFDHLATKIQNNIEKNIPNLQDQFSKKQSKQISDELNKLSSNNIEIFLYDENAIVWGHSDRKVKKIIEINESVVDIINNPYLFTYIIEINGKIFECWIFYYPLLFFVTPYIIVISFIVLSIYLLINFSFINKKVKVIDELHDGVGILASGDLHYQITCQESDELGELGTHLNYMRKSILDSLEKEEEARKANQELINTMSHDLRTPLTSLMGYLEILKYGKYEVSQLDNYLNKCMDKCEQLKNRADSLFNYFVVFSEEKMEFQEMTVFQFMNLVANMKEELELDGFQVKMNELTEDAMLQIDLRQMERVFDNIRSNLMKYATKDSVEIYLQLENRFTIQIKNDYAEIQEVESYHIGLKSVNKIMEAHHGFMIVERKSHFIMTLGFPISKIF